MPEDIIYNFLLDVKNLALELDIPRDKQAELLQALDQLIAYYQDVNE